jgi:hypothetical protein
LPESPRFSLGQISTWFAKNDGTVAAWGANNEGQTNLPAGITTATEVAAGLNHGLALLANGSVVAWWRGGTTPTAKPV